MKEIILGTAGHIDHGKTSLVKALTGINTDRLKEEQERGITIELGFAFLDLPGGRRVGIVDVPGHEKFVKNMVAGATGIDVVALIIAADEGVMPQTREHMEICSLLDVQAGLVVLTKTDLVDEEWRELVLDDIRGFVKGTFLENAPILPVSAVTGEGIPEFVHALEELTAQVPIRSSSGIFRLPVDRVFTMKGFGTVITGTLISGRIQVGDAVMIYPSGLTSKVRGIQVHNESVNEAEAGMRTAINFQGLEKSAINRGEVISTPGALIPSYMIDVHFQFLKSNKKAMKNRTRMRFHTGTGEILGNVVLLDREELLPGDAAEVQLRLDEPVALVKDDRFVLRSYSPVRTIGGGFVLNPVPRKHKRFKDDIIESLESIVESTPEEIIAYHVKASDYSGISFPELKIMTNLPEKQLNNRIQDLLSRQALILVDRENRIFIHRETFDKLKAETAEWLTNYHKSFPLKEGMPKEELKSRLPRTASPKLLTHLLNQMIKDGEIASQEETIRLAGHKISLGADQADIRKKLLAAYQEGGLQPPYFSELARTMNLDADRVKDVLMLLVGEGLLVKVKEDLFFHVEAVEALKKKLVDFLAAQGEISTPQFKEMTGASRKYVIPLIEYFDSRNVTIRIGDIRKLRGR